MVYGLMGFPHKYLEKGIGANHVNVSLLKWDMYHRIRAFGQEADDTRTVNHLKRLQTEKATLPSFPPFRDLSVAIYLPRYGHQNSESLADQSWLEVRDTCCVLGWGGPGLGVGGGGGSSSLGRPVPESLQWAIASRTDLSSSDGGDAKRSECGFLLTQLLTYFSTKAPPPCQIHFWGKFKIQRLVATVLIFRNPNPCLLTFVSFQIFHLQFPYLFMIRFKYSLNMGEICREFPIIYPIWWIRFSLLW